MPRPDIRKILPCLVPMLFNASPLAILNDDRGGGAGMLGYYSRACRV